MSKHLVRAVAAGIALLACSAAEEAGLSGPQLSAHGNGVLASATGSGHYYVADEIRTLAFSAVQHADGSASGEYQIDVHASNTSFHATVTCMAVVGNTAWIAGVIDWASGPPVIPGTVTYFYAKDNGEGTGAAPDIVSVARINDRPEADEEFCTTRPLGLPPREVVNGNVQVR